MTLLLPLSANTAHGHVMMHQYTVTVLLQSYRNLNSAEFLPAVVADLIQPISRMSQQRVRE